MTSVSTTSTLSVSALRHMVMRHRARGSRILHPIAPVGVSFSTMKRSKRGSRGVPAPVYSQGPVSNIPVVPLRMEISSLNWHLHPIRRGDIGAGFVKVIQAKLARLEACLAISIAHKRSAKGTALVGSMAVKPDIVEVSQSEKLRREIADEICGAGGFVGPTPRTAHKVAAPAVRRRRRPNGSRKVSGVSWLAVVETHSVAA